jgi:predicted ATPase
MTPPTSAENGSTAGLSAGGGPLRLRTAESAARTEPTPRSRELTPHYLPLELSSFVGREREISELKGLVGQTRLLTLTGPGGSGKTRLVLAVAQEAVEEFEDGTWWVELAPVYDPELVPRAVVQVLNVPELPGHAPTEALVDHLKGRKVLLILDNCEHLVEGCAELADTLLRACSELRILRRAESLCAWPASQTGRCPACRCRLRAPARSRRAGELRGRMPLRRAGSGRRCGVRADGGERLHGSTAMLEAGWHPAGHRARGGEGKGAECRADTGQARGSLELLTTGSRTAAARHKTLKATLGWSYGLLNEAKRALFRRLSVVVGDWDPEAAEAVGAGESVEAGRVLDVLSALVDKSLVAGELEAGGALRYGMLEAVMQFGREKLYESREEPEIRCRHAEHYLALAEAAEPELLRADQVRWLRRLRTEFANLREAHAWSLESGEGEGRAQLRLRLAAALWRSWATQRFEEGKVWLQTALESDTGGFPAVKTKALGALGFILFFQQDYERAIVALEEA